MSSPFPGMDLFIESQRWRDFHHSIIPQIRDDLQRAVQSRYVISIEENVYVSREAGSDVSLAILIALAFTPLLWRKKR